MNSLIKFGAARSTVKPVQLLIRARVQPTTLRTFSIQSIRKPLFNEFHPIQFQKVIKRYSSTAPPPPPPPPHQRDKREKSRQLLKKITNAFTFSISSVVVLAASGVALLVIYLILSELFLPSGDTRTFNKAVKLVEKSELAQHALQAGKGERLKAYGEYHTADSWTRNRPIHGIRSKGKDGKDHLLMQFHVESSLGRNGTVTLEQVDTSFWLSEFAYIALDVAGVKRVYVIEPKFQAKSYVPKLASKDGFLGLKWGPKKDE